MREVRGEGGRDVRERDREVSSHFLHNNSNLRAFTSPNLFLHSLKRRVFKLLRPILGAPGVDGMCK